MNRDLYQEVTDPIVAAVEAGTPPWVKPSLVTDDLRPMNPEPAAPTGASTACCRGLRPNSGATPTAAGSPIAKRSKFKAHVCKGGTGSTVVFYKRHEADAKAEDVDGGERREVPLFRAFTGFNFARVEGRPPGLTEPPKPPTREIQCQTEALVKASGAVIRSGGARACYDQTTDVIHLPDRGAFEDLGCVLPHLAPRAGALDGEPDPVQPGPQGPVRGCRVRDGGTRRRDRLRVPVCPLPD